MTTDEQRLFKERAERLEAYRQRIAELEAALAEARKDGERLKKVLYVLSMYKGSALGCNPQILFTAISDAARGAK